MSGKLADQMTKETNVESKNRATVNERIKKTVGLKDRLLANGYQNARHFAGALQYRETITIIGGTFLDLGPVLLNLRRAARTKAPDRRIYFLNRVHENFAEFFGNLAGAAVSKTFEDLLAKDTPWYAQSAYFDAAWDAHKEKLADLWRKHFCR